MEQARGMNAVERSCARVRVGRARNADRDAIDEADGVASPPQCGPLEMLRTAVFALHATLGKDNWDFVEEATALIEDALGIKLSEP